MTCQFPPVDGAPCDQPGVATLPTDLLRPDGPRVPLCLLHYVLVLARITRQADTPADGASPCAVEPGRGV